MNVHNTTDNHIKLFCLVFCTFKS